MAHSKTKGFLTLLILWIISKKNMTGAEIALELQNRKGRKPSPGTIYPVLKSMKERNLVSIDENKSYTLTEKGEKSLENHLRTFIRTFHDIDEMKSCCCEHKLTHTKSNKDGKHN